MDDKTKIMDKNYLNDNTKIINKKELQKKGDTLLLSKKEIEEPITGYESESNVPTKKLKKAKKTKKFKFFTWTSLLIIMIIVIVVSGVTAGLYYRNIIANAPECSDAQLFQNPNSRIFASDGRHMTDIGNNLFDLATNEEIPQMLKDGYIAVEDASFYTHNGLSFPRFAKAMFDQVRGQDTGGGSTITMQVAKMRCTKGGNEEGLMKQLNRKATDIYLATNNLEKKYDKDQILNLYLNNLEYAHRIVGVKKAALYFFGKDLNALTLPENAFLVGVINAPSSYDPYSKPNAANDRKNVVLDNMEARGYITKVESDAAKAIHIADLINPKKNLDKHENQSYIDRVVKEVLEKYKIDMFTTAVDVHTYFDTNVQNTLNDTVNNATFANDEDQVGISTIDVKTGGMVAFYSGRNRSDDAALFDLANDMKRQIGSTAKPIFDYAPAYDSLPLSPDTSLYDFQKTYYTYGGFAYNWDMGSQGMISLRKALAHSRNSGAIQLFQAVGIDRVYDYISKMGLAPDTREELVEASAIGGGPNYSPTQIAAAYATIANEGKYNEPTTIKLIKQPGKEDIVHTPKNTVVFSPQAAWFVFDTLIVANRGGGGVGVFAPDLNIPGLDMGTKTGTTNFSDADLANYGYPAIAVPDQWVVGITKQYATSVWYGYEKNIPDRYIKFFGGGDYNKKVFRKYMAAISDTSLKLEKPDGFVTVSIEKDTLPPMLPSATTPADKIMSATFIAGREPKNTSFVYQQLSTPANMNLSKDDANKKFTVTGTVRAETPKIYDSGFVSKHFSEFFKTQSTHYNNAFNERIKSEFGGEIAQVIVEGPKGLVFEEHVSVTQVNQSVSISFPYPLEAGTYTVKLISRHSSTEVLQAISQATFTIDAPKVTTPNPNPNQNRTP